MRRTALVVAASLAAVAPVAFAPASAVPVADQADRGAHGNHVSVDPQVSADGTVVAETAASLTSGFLVLHADDGGAPGDPVGHTFLNGSAFRTDVPVAVEPDTWADWSGNRTLWAVLHADDGDGAFDPADDPSLASRSPTARQSFALGRGDAPVHVLARQFEPLAVREGSVTVRRVTLAEAGHLVVTPHEGDAVLGTRSLDAGTHANVSVALNASYLADREDPFRLRFAIYRDDGDGTFDDADRLVRVDGAPVATDAIARVANGTATATGPLVVTPSPTATPDTATDAATTARPTGGADATATATDGAGATGPGFGPAAALLALVGTVLVGSWRASR